VAAVCGRETGAPCEGVSRAVPTASASAAENRRAIDRLCDGFRFNGLLDSRLVFRRANLVASRPRIAYCT
jgi:hypothetical protein